MKDKDKKQTKHLSRFVRRSLLTLSALSLLSGVMPSSDTIRTGIGSVTHSRAMSSSGNVLTDAGRSMTSLLGTALSASGFAPLTAYAATWPTPDFAVESEGAILIDADSGAVLYEKNATTAYYPASITKVLTAIIVLENCTNLEDKVTFSYAAVNTNLEQNSTIIGAVAGDKLSVRDCLYGLLL